MKKVMKKSLCALLALAMVCTGLVLPGTEARAVENVTYIDEHGASQTCESATEVGAGMTTWDTSTGGWYVVSGTVNVADRITVTGDVKLILADGYTLTAEKGINVPEGASLTIYGQSGQSGTLTATGTDNNAAIGGNKGGATGTITINGGNVTATGGHFAAGIGAGQGYSSFNITINGGTINATGDCGAGIGNGSGGSGTIIITGGNITVGSVDSSNRSQYGYGIGNGYNCYDTHNITISGGVVHANTARNYSISGTFSTGENGNAIIYARTGTLNTSTENENYIFVNTSDYSGGKVYGSPALSEDFELESMYTLTVPEDAVLIIPAGVTLTVNGTITNNGHVIKEAGGTIVNGGNIQPAAENGPVYGVSVDVTMPKSVNYGETTEAKTITITNTGVLATTIKSVELSGANAESFALTGGETGELAKRNDTNESWTIQPNDKLDAGTYNATVTVTYTGRNGAVLTAEKDVSLTVGQATATVTPPTSKGSLTYNGDEQELVTRGSVSGGPGTMQYSLDVAGEYSPNVPKKKDVGSYTVYWKVDGADTENYNYGGETSGEVTVEITQGQADVKPTNNSIEYTYGDASGITLEVTVEPKNTAGIALASAGENQVEFVFPKGGKTETKTVDAGGGTVSVNIPANEVKDYFNAGVENTVTVNYGGSGNLNVGSTTITVTVNKKQLNLKFTATDRQYDGTKNVNGSLDDFSGQLVSGDNVTATAKATVASADAETNKDVTVEVTLTGDQAEYYTANKITGVTVDIEKADLTERDVTAPTGKGSVDYTGDPEQLLDEAGSAPEGCTVKYAVKTSADGEPGDDDWKETYTDITGRDAGTYCTMSTGR